MMHPSGGIGKIGRGPSPLQPGALLLWKAVDQDGSTTVGDQEGNWLFTVF